MRKIRSKGKNAYKNLILDSSKFRARVVKNRHKKESSFRLPGRFEICCPLKITLMVERLQGFWILGFCKKVKFLFVYSLLNIGKFK